MQDPIPEIRGWQTRRDRRRHGSPQLVPGCRHQLGQVPLRLLLPSAGGQARQGKTSRRGGKGVAANGSLRGDSVDSEDEFSTCRLSCLTSTHAGDFLLAKKNLSGILIVHVIYIRMGLVLSHTTRPLHAYMPASPKPPNDVAVKTSLATGHGPWALEDWLVSL